MALVQQAAEAVNNSGSGTVDVVFGGNTTAGNLLVFICFNVDSTGAVFASTGFGVDVSRAVTTGGAVVALSQANIAGGTTTYTVTYSGGSKFRVIGYEFNSVVTTSHVEVTGSNGGNTTGGDMYAAPSGSIDTTQGGPIVSAYLCDRTPSSFSGPSGWTGGGTVGTASSTTLFQGYANYTIATGVSTDERGPVTPGGSGPNYDAVIVAYKAGGGGGGSATGAAAHYYRQMA